MNQYFPHDFKARSDKKLVSLFMTHGASGIGIFWCIVEMLYEENGYVLRSEYDRIAFELRDHPDCIKAIVEESGLFKFDDDKFWSESVLNRIQVREEKSQKARKSIEKRWNNTNVLRPKNDCNTIKEKKRKEKKKKVFIAPSFQEFLQYCQDNNHKNIAERAFKGYEAGEWKDSQGKQIINWKQKLQHVWFKEENKDSATTQKGLFNNDPRGLME